MEWSLYILGGLHEKWYIIVKHWSRYNHKLLSKLHKVTKSQYLSVDGNNQLMVTPIGDTIKPSKKAYLRSLVLHL